MTFVVDILSSIFFSECMYLVSLYAEDTSDCILNFIICSGYVSALV